MKKTNFILIIISILFLTNSVKAELNTSLKEYLNGKDLEKGSPIPVIITAYKDRSFDFTTKLPPVSFYLKKVAKIKKGNSTPGRTLVGKVSMQDIEKIAKEKMQDLNAIDLNGAMKMVKGSAVSMGMEVVG